MGKRIDALIEAFAPKLATKRAVEQVRREVVGHAREAFRAASHTRLNAGWDYSFGNVNVALQTRLKILRERSRWLVANNPHASSALNTLLNYVIGTGMMPQATVRKMVSIERDGETAVEAQEMDAWNDYVDDLFRQWSDHVDATATEYNPQTFHNLQTMALRRWFADGEVIIRTRNIKAWPVVPFACEIMLPEWLDESIRKASNGNEVIMGVEVDSESRPVAYHFRKARPDGQSTIESKTIRIPAENIIHSFVRHYPRQVRGIPPMVSIMERFYQLDEYVDFELIGAKIAACFGAFITTPAGDSGNVLSQADSSGEGKAITDSEGNVLTTVEPGIIGHLPPGYDVRFAQPQKPGATFGVFTEYNQRSLGAGIEFGLSYESITRDTSRSSYAGGRLSQLMDFQTFRAIQTMIAKSIIRPIWYRWLESAILSAAITAPGYFTNPGREFWRRHEVLSSGWPWGINPLQEVNASRESMRAGITTLADEAAYLGRDWKQQLRLKAKIDREAKRLGVVITSDGAINKSASAGVAQNDEAQVDAVNEGEQAAKK